MTLSALARQIAPLVTALDALDAATTPQDILRSLKAVRNLCVGNKSRKLALCGEARLSSLLRCINYYNKAHAEISSKIQLEAISIVGIVAIPEEKSIAPLLLAKVPEVLWSKVQTLPQPTCSASEEETALWLTLMKSIRALHGCMTGLCGPRIWTVATLFDAKPVKDTYSRNMSTLVGMDVDEEPTLQELVHRATALAHTKESLAALLAILTSIPSSVATSELEVNEANLDLATITCLFLSNYLRTHVLQTIFVNYELPSRSATPPLLVALLGLLDYSIDCQSHRGTKLKTAVCQAITALVKGSGEVASRVQTALTRKNALVVDVICSLAREKESSLSLAASACVVTLFKAMAIEPEPLVLHLLRSEQIKPIMGVLLRLLQDEQEIATSAACNLAYLVSNDNELQEVACDMGALPMLQTLLKKSLRDSEEVYIAKDRSQALSSFRESILLAVAALSLTQERLRKLVVDADLLPLVVQCLSDDTAEVRAAACQCARGLSRSLNVLRSHLVDAGAAGPLIDLLNAKEDLALQATAASTCANLLIEYSPMKEALITRNALPRIVELTKSSDTSLRVAALFAIKNLTCWSTSSLKEVLMHDLSYEHLHHLCQYSDEETQVQSLGVIRNLASNKAEDIETVVDGIGEAKMMQLLEDKLCSPLDEVVLQTLFIVLNSAASKRCHALLLSRGGITRALLSHLSHGRSDIRVASVRAVKNLAAREPTQRAKNDNALRLRALGFESRLRGLKEDPILDVREHARICLDMFAQSDFRSNSS